MSLVTNVIMTTGIEETKLWQTLPLMGKLKQVDQYAGGSKAMECDVYLAAYNYLNHEKLLAEFWSVAWDSPDETWLMIKKQDDDGFTIYSANVRDHRRLPVARFLHRSVATSRKRDAGSRSVDRIVRLFIRSGTKGEEPSQLVHHHIPDKQADVVY
jgi:hypothetical protein